MIFGSWKKREVGVIFLPIVLPLLLLLGVLSIPWAFVVELVNKRREGKFVEQMQVVGRLLARPEFQAAVGRGQGTTIMEFLSVHGPRRIWWTETDIPALSPYECCFGKHGEWLDPKFQPFSEWCYEKFTSPVSGAALLVQIPASTENEFYKRLPPSHFVKIYSPRQQAKQSGKD